jgi:chemotaxis response regulator CheB
MVFVVISHVSRVGPTQLPWLLSRWSKMPAQLARRRLVLQPNHIYVIPPGQEMMLEDGHFHVQPKSKLRGWSNVVTLFLESLVRWRKPPGVAVILSGLDADGAAALQTFRQRGGITIVQDLRTAEREDMPRSAIQTGAADYVLPPESIADLLEEIGREYAAMVSDTGQRHTTGASAQRNSGTKP